MEYRNLSDYFWIGFLFTLGVIVASITPFAILAIYIAMFLPFGK